MPEFSTTELRAAGFPINRRRPRPNPKLAAVEAARVARVRSTRRSVMGNRFLWYPTAAPARELPLTMRHRRRWITEFMVRMGLPRGWGVRPWPAPPPGLL